MSYDMEIDKNIDFFEYLSIMMKGDGKLFLNKYFGTWNDVKTSVMLMKTYQVCENELKKKNEEYTEEDVAKMVKKAILNPQYREQIVKFMDYFMNNENLTFPLLTDTPDKTRKASKCASLPNI
jgi:hypothetical protein